MGLFLIVSLEEKQLLVQYYPVKPDNFLTSKSQTVVTAVQTSSNKHFTDDPLSIVYKKETNSRFICAERKYLQMDCQVV